MAPVSKEGVLICAGYFTPPTHRWMKCCLADRDYSLIFFKDPINTFPLSLLPLSLILTLHALLVFFPWFPARPSRHSYGCLFLRRLSVVFRHHFVSSSKQGTVWVRTSVCVFFGLHVLVFFVSHFFFCFGVRVGSCLYNISVVNK